MARTVLFLICGLVGAVAIALFWPRETQEFAYSSSASDLPLMARVAELERTVQYEARQRAALQDEIAALREQLAATGAVESDAAGGEQVAFLRRLQENAGEDNEQARERVREQLASRFDEARSNRDWRRMSTEERLVDAGFTPQRAQWIDRRTEELAVEAMEARYAAERSGDVFENVDTDQLLRQELGESDYERYREATRQSMSVSIGDVLASSAAERAGLAPGDEIVSYAGQRVYETADLNRLALEGTPGESVVVDIVRDGQQMQLVLTRGPLGISAFGRGRGRR